MWREIRTDRLEVGVLTDLFGADKIADDGERHAAKDRAFKALAMLLRYKSRIEREHRAAMEHLAALRQRRLGQPSSRPSEPETAVRPSEPRRHDPARHWPQSLPRPQRRCRATPTTRSTAISAGRWRPCRDAWPELPFRLGQPPFARSVSLNSPSMDAHDRASASALYLIASGLLRLAASGLVKLCTVPP